MVIDLFDWSANDKFINRFPFTVKLKCNSCDTEPSEFYLHAIRRSRFKTSELQTNVKHDIEKRIKNTCALCTQRTQSK